MQIMGLAVGIALGLSFNFGTAQQPATETTRTIRVGMQATGTFSWVVHAMQSFGIGEELGLDIEPTTYATKQATELALRAGEVDVVVDDFIGVMLLRENGIPVRAIYPYSKATGGVVVPADSEIRTVADLKGKTIGAASLDDKSLLILRALAVDKYGFDPQTDSKTIAVAPPLMQEFLKRGDLDAAIPYWHFVARMVATGEFRNLMEVTAMLDELGLPSDLPILVVVGRDGADPEALRTFLRALVMTTDRMKTDDDIWDSILEEGLYSLPDPSLFPAVRQSWEEGVPERWNQDIIDGLVSLADQLVEIAGADVVGVKSIDPAAFTTEFVPD